MKTPHARLARAEATLKAASRKQEAPDTPEQTVELAIRCAELLDVAEAQAFRERGLECLDDANEFLDLVGCLLWELRLTEGKPR